MNKNLIKIILFFLIILYLFSCQNSGISKDRNDKKPNEDKYYEELCDTCWKSNLYPNDWTPGYTDEEGRFLHDFSYAGYHMGEQEIGEDLNLPLIDVTEAPYNADNTGSSDATEAIQDAIYTAGGMGGAIVYLPAGTYLVKPPTSGEYAKALEINSNNIILRGAGNDQTFLLNTETFMRKSHVILVYPKTTTSTYSNHWISNKINETSVTKEYSAPTQQIEVASITEYSVNDWIIIYQECNNNFINDLSMDAYWNDGDIRGPHFFRQINKIEGNAIYFTIPTRFPIKAEYNPTVYKIDHVHLEEIGIEDLSIGMIENSTNESFGDEDYNTVDTAAYEVHGSHAINFRFVINGWIKNVNTFKPADNTGDYHLLSNGILINDSRNITIKNCVFQKPQYEGGGGNGYMFTLSASDCLITECTAIHSRHNYDLKTTAASGNVITRSIGKDARLSSDFHMHFSMANLFNCMTMDKDWLQGNYRPWGTIEHGQTTSESVFWNTTGLNYHSSGNRIVESQQWGWGYIIGTQGDASEIEVLSDEGRGTNPVDYVEGEGLGATLFPESLYESQFIRRMIREQ